MRTATFTLRPPRAEDVPHLVELEKSSAREAGVEATTSAEDILRSWDTPRFDPARNQRVAEVDGAVVGEAGYETLHEQAHGSGYVLPEHRARGIGSALLRWMVDSAAERPEIRVVHTWTRADFPSAIRLIEGFGDFRYARSFFRMKNTSPADVKAPVWPDGVRLVALESDELIDAVIAGYDGSFVDHWNFHPAERDEFTFWLESPREDPALWFVAKRGEQLAGFCLCHLDDRGTVVRGNLGPIGTLRAFRGIGLGRALLRHGVRALAARGCGEVTLGVDSQNPNGAVGLYERTGFVVQHEGRVYARAL